MEVEQVDRLIPVKPRHCGQATRRATIPIPSAIRMVIPPVRQVSSISCTPCVAATR